MSVSSCFKNVKTPCGKACWVLYVLLLSLLVFFATSYIIFIIAFVLKFGLSVETFTSSALSEVGIFNFPVKIIELYGTWYKSYVVEENLRLLAVLPIAAILFSVIFFVWMCCTPPFRKKFAFAKIEDLKNLDVLGNGDVLFGALRNKKIKSQKATSSFVWFGKSLGKTTAVAIPTILDADDSNLIAVDCSGILSRFTSGHRNKVSKVYNFDWNKVDGAEEGVFYPRWNPLSPSNMPKKKESRDSYVKMIAQYMAVNKVGNYWEGIAAKLLEALIHFFAYKTDHASANDYFLNKIMREEVLTDEDKQLLHSYYMFMPESLSKKAIELLQSGNLNVQNYLPIGSWYNIPPSWQGKEFCFPMLADILIHRYCSVKHDGVSDNIYLWRDMLEEFMEEVALFNYGFDSASVFEYVITMTRQQRWLVFSMIMDVLNVFCKKSIRERTSLSDIKTKDILGGADKNLAKNKPISLYLVADTKESAFMTKFFLEVLFVVMLNNQKNDASTLVVLDDFELMPKVRMLSNLLAVPQEANISSLILTNEISDINARYEKNIMEDIMKHTKYKLLSSENNAELIEKFKQLSIFDVRAGQINSKSGINHLANPEMAFKSPIYRGIVEGLEKLKVKDAFTKGKYLLLVEGHYDCPIKLESLFFAKQDAFRRKAGVRDVVSLDEAIIERRNLQDIDVPNIVDVVGEAGIIVSSEEDLAQYLNDKKDFMMESMSELRNSYYGDNEKHHKLMEKKKLYMNKMKIEALEAEANWHPEEKKEEVNDLEVDEG